MFVVIRGEWKIWWYNPAQVDNREQSPNDNLYSVKFSSVAEHTETTSDEY